jgi:hypothetical protein
VSLPLADALAPEHTHRAGDQPWWLAAPELKHAIEQGQPAPRTSAYYRFGDAVLEITSDTKRLFVMFEQLYGDCAVPAPAAPDRPRVRCVVRRGGEPPLLLMTFLEGAPRDPASAFLPMRATRVWESPLPGWRLAGGAEATILAACGAHVLINLRQAWEHYPIEYLVNATLTAQPDLVAVHAASLGMNKAGLLLAGPSESGKSTTALHLAARGLTLLGDEVALIRLATSEILPFRRTAHLRPGPRTPELSAAVAQLAGRYKPAMHDASVAALHIGELFPGEQAGPANLRAAFFLAGFAERPSLAPFRPTLHDLNAFSVLAGNEIATLWGLPVERRALRLLAVKQLLDRLPCCRLEIGAPAETAELIERTMENL